MPMHDDEVALDDRTVRSLVDEQFPAWRDLRVRHVPGGTVNAIHRIGDAYAARFPLHRADPAIVTEGIRAEARAMRELASVCPVPTPMPVAAGAPGAGYPMPWSVQTWIDGAVATPDGLADDPVFARDLAELVLALRGADTLGRPFDGQGRGGTLSDADAWVAESLGRSAEFLPVDELRSLWARLRELPAGRPVVMSHRDLIPANLLVRDGRLVGVLDGGSFGPADPALDLIVGWHLLGADARAVFRAAVGADDLDWARGAAWAFEQAIGLPWYYRESNPGMAELGRSTLRRVLDGAAGVIPI